MEKEIIIPNDIGGNGISCSGISGNGICGNGTDFSSGSFELDEREFEMLSKELSM